MLLIRSQVNTRKGVSTLILILNIKGKTNVQVRATVETSEFGFLFVFDYFANLMILFSDCPKCLLTHILAKGLCEESYKYLHEGTAEVKKSLNAVVSFPIFDYESE